MAMEIAKAGWLDRQSSLLKRWKRNWFVLYQNGDLSYFETPDSMQFEERLVVCAACIAIKTGSQCNFAAPEGKSLDARLQLQLREGQDWCLCADDTDDMRAWQISLEEARVINRGTTQPGMPPPPTVMPGTTTIIQGQPTVIQGQPYPCNMGYPGQVLSYGTHPPAYVVHNAANGRPQMVVGATGAPTNVVYVQDDPYYYRRGYRGPVMWGPLLWW